MNKSSNPRMDNIILLHGSRNQFNRFVLRNLLRRVVEKSKTKIPFFIFNKFNNIPTPTLHCSYDRVDL